jgi:hypothetical protein
MEQSHMSGSQQPQGGNPSLSRRAYAVSTIFGFQEVGISYSTLLREPVFDEADKQLLRQLYEEAGIAMQPEMSLLQSTLSTDSHVHDQSTKARLDQSGQALQSSSQISSLRAEGANMQSTANPQKPGMSTSPALPGLSSSMKVNSIPGLNQPPISQARVPSLASLAPETSSAESAPPPVTTLNQLPGEQLSERELFLQRLKAARTKKLAASSGSPAPAQATSSSAEVTPTTIQTVSSILPVNAAGSTPLAPLDTSSTQIARQQVSVTSTIPGIPRKDPSNVVRINNAELQRRMESMREQAAQAKVRPVLPSRSASMSSIDYSQGRDSDASESMQSVDDSSQGTPHMMSLLPNAGTAVSFVPSQAQSRPSIPGLFMGEPAVSSAPPTQQAVSSPNFTSTVTVPQPPAPSTSQSSLRPQPPGFQPTPVQYSPARNSSTYSNQAFQAQTNTLKRPASATSGPIRFGAPKRPFGYSQYNSFDEQVVIDISSDEDEEDSDVMDIDEDEGAQYSRPTPAASRHRLPPRPPAVTNNLPPRPNFNGRPFQQSYSNSSSAVPTPPSAQTPNPMDIQRQHDAIEQERKKLQEQLNKKLEEKKKMKDGATNSPGQTTPMLGAKPQLATNPSEVESTDRTSSADLLQSRATKVSEVQGRIITPERHYLYF